MMNLTRTLFLLFIFLLLFTGEALAAGTVVTTTGGAELANVTPEEAQNRALQRARTNAIEQVCGVMIQAETLVKDYVMQADIVHSVTYGRIISEEIVRWEIEVDQVSPLKPPALSYLVTIKAEVVEEKGEPDPFFYNVKTWLNT